MESLCFHVDVGYRIFRTLELDTTELQDRLVQVVELPSQLLLMLSITLQLAYTLQRMLSTHIKPSQLF